MIHALTIDALAAHGDRTAVVAADGAPSYRQLVTAITGFAQVLLTNGVAPGYRVAVQLPNSVAAVVALLAVAAVGAVPIPVPAALRGAGLKALVDDCDAQRVICPANIQIEWNCPAISAPVSSVADVRPINCAVRSTEPNELAMMIYTSGSTGGPKGVMLSRANMASVLAAVHAYLKPSADDVFYSALPLSSSYGFYQMASALSLGAKIALDKSFAFPVQSMRFLAEQRATVFAAVPTQIAWMLEAPDVRARGLESLRIVTTAAAALPIEHARRLQQVLPQAQIFAMYGQTECKRISYLEPAELLRRPGSVGRGLSIQRHLIVDAQGMVVDAGESGELVVQGPHVMQGYWRKPKLTDEKLRSVPGEPGLWLYTGDEFRADAEGYLYFVGRRDEILKIGAHKVSPTDIENVILELDAVNEVAVVGAADERWGSVAFAYAVLKQGAALDEATLQRHCAARLPRYMVPKSVRFLPSLPKTDSGKIRKIDLR